MVRIVKYKHLFSKQKKEFFNIITLLDFDLIKFEEYKDSLLVIVDYGYPRKVLGFIKYHVYK